MQCAGVREGKSGGDVPHQSPRPCYGVSRQVLGHALSCLMPGMSCLTSQPAQFTTAMYNQPQILFGWQHRQEFTLFMLQRHVIGWLANNTIMSISPHYQQNAPKNCGARCGVSALPGAARHRHYMVQVKFKNAAFQVK